ncbi:MAG: hypothetical protein HFG54_11485 [Lachnospiraceae bacterium]|jgi:hypothetical protein|nr:hypothetical protein [Lachnospiraceae bacterium]
MAVWVLGFFPVSGLKSPAKVKNPSTQTAIFPLPPRLSITCVLKRLGSLMEGISLVFLLSRQEGASMVAWRYLGYMWKDS